MDLEELQRGRLGDANNTLVLAPLTPWGTTAYNLMLAGMCEESANLIVVTYTQPPQLWLTEWKKHTGWIPDNIAFIHGGPATGEKIDDVEANVESHRVNPRRPMDIISAVTSTLDDWADLPGQSVVSVQTLTVLLEYVEFETTFRYLHVLNHRIRGAQARGFYQMDPGIHEPETINTLSVLFDVVIRADGGESDNTEWSIETTMPRADEQISEASEAIGPMHPENNHGVLPDMVGAIRSTVGGLWAQVERLSPGESTAPQPASSDAHQILPDAPHTNTHREEDDLLTDEERVRRLLLQAGGRMSQADIVENTDWSAPTVSRKLSGLEDEGVVTRIQVGRGNLVFLEGHQPDIAESVDHEVDDR